MNPHDIDDPIEALRAELQRVQPPAGYVARLRQRVDAEAGAPVRAGWWRWALPLVAVAAVLLAITINRPAPPAPIAETTRVEQPAVAPVAPASQPSMTAPTTQPPATRVVRAPETTRRVASANPNTTAPQTDAEPMPEIITNQAEVFRALWARSAPKATLVESTKPVPDPAAEIVVAPIEILPIVITPLTDAGKPGSLPIVRPPNRDSSEGRAK